MRSRRVVLAWIGRIRCEVATGVETRTHLPADCRNVSRMSCTGQSERFFTSVNEVLMETSLVKGMNVLSALAHSGEPMGVSSLAEALSLNKSNVHRLLNALVELGYVEQIPSTRKYAPTVRIWELGSAVVDRHPLRRASRPVLREFFGRTGKTVYVAQLMGAEILYIDAIESVIGFRSGTRLGSRTPLGFTAAGKIILAYQPDPELLLREAMELASPEHELDPETVMAELELCRSKGYGTSQSGWTATHNSLAVAIPSASGPPTAALGVTGVPSHLDLRDVGELVSLLSDSSVRIAESLF